MSTALESVMALCFSVAMTLFTIEMVRGRYRADVEDCVWIGMVALGFLAAVLYKTLYAPAGLEFGIYYMGALVSETAFILALPKKIQKKM